ncbi:PREDICTED: odorant receptor 13a-like [Eufriesea mexicana]|uniref:odorant receptor 13a-like n=1 Tax=Eufriesea mexicana TaxID=516756 RepID=UPI00083BD9D3|nr:PREDICTED: odorant receptor 13a-like [Eufriesea mexicana]
MEKSCFLRGLYNVWGVNYDAVIECIPPVISIFLSLSMYLNGIFNVKKIKDMLLFIKNNHDYYMNRPENMILRYYNMQGKKITFYYASYVYITVLVYLMLPTVPLITDLVIPSNHSQKKNFLYELDYGVDKEQYFYYICIHSYVGTTMIANLISSCDTTYMLYAQHAYALFAIVSYKLRTIHIMDTNYLINMKDHHVLENYKNIELLPAEQKKVYRKLFICIKEHQNAIKYSNLLESLFSKSILAQLFFNVLCFSITGVEVVMKVGNISEMIRFGSFTFAQAVHIFFLCLPGQRLLNHSEEVYVAACEVIWYILPKKCHNLYKLLLARTLISSKITAFKLTIMRMETFLTIIQSAMSYFTVLLSTI